MTSPLNIPGDIELKVTDAQLIAPEQVEGPAQSHTMWVCSHVEALQHLLLPCLQVQGLPNFAPG